MSLRLMTTNPMSEEFDEWTFFPFWIFFHLNTKVLLMCQRVCYASIPNSDWFSLLNSWKALHCSLSASHVRLMGPHIGQWDLGMAIQLCILVQGSDSLALAIMSDRWNVTNWMKLHLCYLTEIHQGEILDHTINQKNFVNTLDTKIFRVICFTS